MSLLVFLNTNVVDFSWSDRLQHSSLWNLWTFSFNKFCKCAVFLSSKSMSNVENLSDKPLRSNLPLNKPWLSFSNPRFLGFWVRGSECNPASFVGAFQLLSSTNVRFVSQSSSKLLSICQVWDVRRQMKLDRVEIFLWWWCSNVFLEDLTQRLLQCCTFGQRAVREMFVLRVCGWTMWVMNCSPALCGVTQREQTKFESVL